ncbi:MAG TPA: hypothetical protein VM469_06785 [Pseudoxanthomonas sp.]|nr:hypothetical protein [Pseudoxanthomonas sp.]
MRKDMFKVIVERPRTGGTYNREMSSPMDEHSASHESLRERHTRRKWLNENLRPLQRYLQQQVGRPWDKVFAELCAAIDRRSTVQQHVHEHIEDFVAVNVVELAGELQVHRKRSGSVYPLAERWSPRLYVDPVSGLLRRNRLRERARAQEEAEDLARVAARQANRRDLEAHRQLHRYKGIWYDVALAPIPPAGRGPGVVDVLRRQVVVAPGHRGAGRFVTCGDSRLYGRPDVYASNKRQLNTRELRAYGLSNTE